MSEMAKWAQREIPLAVAFCCREYMVSMLHLVPPCTECGMTPIYEGDSPYRLVVETHVNPFVDALAYRVAS